MENLQGQCLCGKTTLTVARLGEEVTACHCSMCRKQAAGPIFYAEKTTIDQVDFNKDETISVYQSSQWGERGFCNQCGTFLYFRNQQDKHISLNPELFQELTEVSHFNKEIFYGDKPDYYEFANETIKEAE